jgi:hypothetical protein
MPAPIERKSRRLSVSPDLARGKKIGAFINSLTSEDYARRGPVIPVPIPTVFEMPDGTSLTVPHSVVDADLSTLDRVRSRLLDRARDTRSTWLVATAHILAAVSDALHAHDFAALNLPHKWARTRLRESASASEGGGFQVWSREYVPVEDAKGRVTESVVAPRFELLVRVIQTAMHETRANGLPLEACTGFVTGCVAHNFPGLPSLAQGDASYEEWDTRIHERIGPLLAAQGAKWASVPPDQAAAEIAETLVRAELRLSGMNETDIDRQLQFLTMRTHRKAKPTRSRARAPTK